MNCRYFACPNCRVYTDAGYRWAYWLLENPGVVQLGEGIDVDSILGCRSYWNPPDAERSEWLCEKILPTVYRFLCEHRDHGLTYIEEEHILAEESLQRNWSEVEGAADA